MNKEILEKYSKETPLGWKVNLLNMLCSSLMCLAESIDEDLRRIKMPDGSTLYFKQKKKRDYNQMCEYFKEGCDKFKAALAKASEKYADLDIDNQVWNIVFQNAARYDNFTADAKEILQEVMLYIDRAQTQEGFYDIMRYLRSLPSAGIFPESEVNRFRFKRPLAPCPGAPVKCQFGEGVIKDQMNGDNWLIELSDGSQKVLTSKQFTISV